MGDPDWESFRQADHARAGWEANKIAWMDMDHGSSEKTSGKSQNMKSLPLFQQLRPEISESKLEAALKDSAIPCKVVRDGRDSVKLLPENDGVDRVAIKHFVAGFNAGYFAF